MLKEEIINILMENCSVRFLDVDYSDIADAIMNLLKKELNGS